MGNCAIKPKVLKDLDEVPPPVEEPKEQIPAEETAAWRSEKGKEILVVDDDDEHVGKRPSLSHLFNEDKTIHRENTEPEPVKLDINNQIDLSSAIPEPVKLDINNQIDLSSAIPEPVKLDINNQSDLSSAIPEPVKLDINNQIDLLSAIPEPEKSVPEISELKVEEIKNQTESSAEVPKVSELNAPRPTEEEVSDNQTGSSLLEIPKVSEVKVPKEMDTEMEHSVPETSEVKEASGRLVFEDAEEKIEGETMARDNTHDNKEDNVFIETENNKKDNVTKLSEVIEGNDIPQLSK